MKKNADLGEKGIEAEIEVGEGRHEEIPKSASLN